MTRSATARAWREAVCLYGDVEASRTQERLLSVRSRLLGLRYVESIKEATARAVRVAAWPY